MSANRPAKNEKCELASLRDEVEVLAKKVDRRRGSSPVMKQALDGLNLAKNRIEMERVDRK